MAYYTNKPCQHAAGNKNWRPNNIFASCVIYTYALIKICIIAVSNKKFHDFRKKKLRHISCNKLNACVRYFSFLHQMIRLTSKKDFYFIFILKRFFRSQDTQVFAFSSSLHFSLLAIARKNDPR